jgi:rRNA maturation RNase YbeY
VHVSLESKKLKLSAAQARKLVQEVLACIESDLALKHITEVNLLITDDERIREINKEYRKKDKPTDVLSFPQFTPAEVQGKKRPKDTFNPYLGDLVISSETTLKQARRFAVTPREELVRLIVHGVLHLCGYDHEKVPPREAQRMRRRERQIRAKILVSKGRRTA